MKEFKKITTLLIIALIIFFMSCTKDDCEYYLKTIPLIDVCPGFKKPNDSLAGMTVVTCYSPTAGGDVAVIFDTRLNSSATPGTDWGTAVSAIHPPSWKENVIGQVFGIAIDNNRSIYLAASNIYNNNDNVSAPATVYRASAPTWTATPYFSLPNTGGVLNGTGNIAFDKKNDQLFTTNLEDGKIYRHSASTSTLLGTFDPWSPDVSSAGIVAQDERVWGVGVNYEGDDVKVYFPRVTSSGAREIFSVTLTTSGAFPSGANPEVQEISGLPGTQSIISDIAFSKDFNKMLLSERGSPHNSRVISYSLTSGVWSFKQQYFIGGGSGLNSSGGLDFYPNEQSGDISSACDESFWVSGNVLAARALGTGKYIYGLEGISYSGNNISTATAPTANQDTDLFIDLNGSYLLNENKNGIGDVEVFDAEECFCQ